MIKKDPCARLFCYIINFLSTRSYLSKVCVLSSHHHFIDSHRPLHNIISSKNLTEGPTIQPQKQQLTRKVCSTVKCELLNKFVKRKRML